MQTICKRGMGLFLALILALSMIFPVAAADASLDDAVNGSAAYMLKTVANPQVGSKIGRASCRERVLTWV